MPNPRKAPRPSKAKHPGSAPIYGIRLRHGDVGGPWKKIAWGIKTLEKANQLANYQHENSFARVAIFDGNKKIKEIAPRSYENIRTAEIRSRGELVEKAEGHYQLKGTPYEMINEDDTGRGWTLYKGKTKIQHFPGHLPEARAKALELSRGDD